MIYRGMDRAALDAAYNNTAAVGLPKRDRYVAGWTARSDTIRQGGGRLDLPYGDGPRQRLDFFACGRPAAPTLAYIHGGYWQMNARRRTPSLAKRCCRRDGTSPCSSTRSYRPRVSIRSSAR